MAMSTNRKEPPKLFSSIFNEIDSLKHQIKVLKACVLILFVMMIFLASSYSENHPKTPDKSELFKNEILDEIPQKQLEFENIDIEIMPECNKRNNK